MTVTAPLQNAPDRIHDDTESYLRLDLDVPVLGPPIADPTPFIFENTGTAFPGQSFVELDRLSSLPMNDVHVLMVNGCLEIPPKAAVNIFVRKYFLLLHPLLPIIDEAQFWEIYNQSNKYLSRPGKISLFLFQAMLLASCAVCGICTDTRKFCRANRKLSSSCSLSRWSTFNNAASKIYMTHGGFSIIEQRHAI